MRTLFRIMPSLHWIHLSLTNAVAVLSQAAFFNNHISSNNNNDSDHFDGGNFSHILLLIYCFFELHPAMSSSITIPTRTAYGGESSKAAASSSSSSYSSSPRPSPQNQTTSTPNSPNNKYGHDRRPSLLSEFPLLSDLPLSAKLTFRAPP